MNIRDADFSRLFEEDRFDVVNHQAAGNLDLLHMGIVQNVS
jgi:hypothetical protein